MKLSLQRNATTALAIRAKIAASAGSAAEAEEVFYANLNILDMVTWSLNKSPSGEAGAVQFM